MRRIVNKDVRLSRELITNPFPNETLRNRLISSKAIDLEDNSVLKDLGNGYMRISPKDEKKLVKL